MAYPAADTVFRANLLGASTVLSGSEETPALRSGLYLLRPPEDSHGVVYVIYWPEETTWDDDAISSVRRNRYTFIR